MVFDSTSSATEEVLSINPLLICFSLKTLTSIIITGQPNLVELIDLELCYNFSILNDHAQMVNFPMQIPSCDSHSSALLD